MCYVTLEEKQAISQYFVPEKRILQLQWEIEQLKKGGGGSTGKVAGGVVSGMGTATGMFIDLFPGMGWVAKATETVIKSGGKLVEAGGNALDNANVREEIQKRNNEIARIKSGDVDRGISDTYMDTIVENLVPDDLYKRALDSLILEESQIKRVKPVYLEDYYIDENNENLLIARGRDGIIRPNFYRVTWLFVTTEQLYIYHYIIDLLTGLGKQDLSGYFYRDIRSIPRFPNSETIAGREQRFFVIKTKTSGDCKCTYRNNVETEIEDFITYINEQIKKENTKQEIIMGDKIEVGDIRGNTGQIIIGKDIHISNSPNERNEIVSKIEKLINFLRQEKIDETNQQTLITNFDKVREEIADEQQPDKSKIFKWLTNTKKALENVVLANHTREAIHWIYGHLHFLVQ